MAATSNKLMEFYIDCYMNISNYKLIETHWTRETRQSKLNTGKHYHIGWFLNSTVSKKMPPIPKENNMTP